MLGIIQLRHFGRYYIAFAVIFCCSLALLLCVEKPDTRAVDISGVSSLFGPGSFLTFIITCVDYTANNWATPFHYLLVGPRSCEEKSAEVKLTEKERKKSNRSWTTQENIQKLTILGYSLAVLFSGSGRARYDTFSITLVHVFVRVLVPFIVFDESAVPLAQDRILHRGYEWSARGIAGECMLEISIILGCTTIALTMLLLGMCFCVASIWTTVVSAPASTEYEQKLAFRVPIPKTVYRLSDPDQAFPLALALVCVLLNYRGGTLKCVKACRKIGSSRGAEHHSWVRSPYSSNWQTLPFVEGSMQRWKTRRWEAHIWNAGRLEERTLEFEEWMKRQKERQKAKEKARMLANLEEVFST